MTRFAMVMGLVAACVAAPKKAARIAGTAHVSAAAFHWPDDPDVGKLPFSFGVQAWLDKPDRSADPLTISIEYAAGPGWEVPLEPLHGDDETSGRLEGRVTIKQPGHYLAMVRDGARIVEQTELDVVRTRSLGGVEHVYCAPNLGARVRDATLRIARWTGNDLDAAWIVEWIPPGQHPIIQQGRASGLHDMLDTLQRATSERDVIGDPDRHGSGVRLWAYDAERYPIPAAAGGAPTPGTWEVHLYREGARPFLGKFEIAAIARVDHAGGSKVTAIDRPAPADVAARLAKVPRLPFDRDDLSTPLAPTLDEVRAAVRSRDVVRARIAVNKVAYAHRPNSAGSLRDASLALGPKPARDGNLEASAAQRADLAKAYALVPALTHQIETFGKSPWKPGERPY